MNPIKAAELLEKYYEILLEELRKSPIPHPPPPNIIKSASRLEEE